VVFFVLMIFNPFLCVMVFCIITTFILCIWTLSRKMSYFSTIKSFNGKLTFVFSRSLLVTYGITQVLTTGLPTTLRPSALLDTRRQHSAQSAWCSLTRHGFNGWPHDSDVYNHGMGCVSLSEALNLLFVTRQSLIRS
jgi:hypothetical protein